MKLEYQCTSLELSKRLKKLDVKQESLFYWYYCYPNGNPPSKWTIQYSTNGLMSDRYSAFTVAEHLAILPHRITLPENEPYNSFRIRIEKGIWVTEQSLKLNDIKYCDFYSVNYYCDTMSEQTEWIFNPMLSKPFTDENLSNALAKMRIYLIENKLIEMSE